jgi:GntR family transcriptional regulator / MocR family aminotransferase
MSKTVLENIALDEESSTPLFEQLAQEIRRVITHGAIVPGDKLPPIRTLSAQLNVSLATVRRAMEELESQGWIIKRHGGGTYVSDQALVSKAVAGHGVSPSATGSSMVRPLALERGEGEAGDALVALTGPARRVNKHFDAAKFYARYDEKVDVDFRVGAPPANVFGGMRWSDSISDWVTDLVSLPREFTDPGGFMPLREAICSWLNSARGLRCTPENLFIVSGGQQARHIASRLLINAGTEVAIEDPGSMFARLMFQSYGATMVPVAVDDSGIVLDELNRCSASKLLYLTPSAQFPTGGVLPMSRRERIASWAQSSDVFIIEDDNNCEFVYESRLPSAIASLAPDNTIYMGSLSQLFSPAWRVGYLVVPRRLRAITFRLKWLLDRCTTPIGQLLLWKLFKGKYLEQHAKRSRQAAELRRNSLIAALRDMELPGSTFTPVKGGLHQTVWLPAQINDVAVFEKCFDMGVGVLPVSPFYLTQPARPGVLLNFSAISDEQIRRGLSVIKEVIGELHGS